MKLGTEKDRLASHALDLKKAFILASCMIGRTLTPAERVLPTYRDWDKKRLRIQVSDLQADVVLLMSQVTESPQRLTRGRPLQWFVSRFERWRDADFSAFAMSDACQFEREVGRLCGRNEIEIPPYAEMWLQPPHSFAFRHPEYMLARDLSALLSFYRDAESLCSGANPSRPPVWAASAGENCQGLARAVIQACFNLLESFVSGLAREHVMVHRIEGPERDRLLDTRKPLSDRIVRVPTSITGRTCPLGRSEDPLMSLFGEIKRRRDAFVHCEPGSSHSARGYVKEIAFHDVGPEVVALAVRSTHEAIRRIWEFVYERPGPRWLPALDDEGRIDGTNLRLVPDTRKLL